MKKVLSIMALFIIFSSPVNAELIIDQNQPDPNTSFGLILGFGYINQQSFKQTHGNIAGAGMFLFQGRGTSGTVTISVWDALPNQIGAKQLASASAIGNAGSWVDVFWTPIPVNPGTTYYLDFTAPNNDLLATTYSPFVNRYVFGEFYQNYIQSANADITFRTYYDDSIPTPTPPPLPIPTVKGSIVGWGADWNENIWNPVPSGDDYVQITAGVYHSLALLSDGSLVGWGNNFSGEINVPSGNNFVQAAAGYYHNVALRADGSLVVWGENQFGQLDGLPGGNDFVKIAAGFGHNLAIRNDGSLVGWGWDAYGQATVPGGEGFVQIAAGGYHSLALRADGSLVGWGYNEFGQATVPEGNDFVQISAGTFHNLALRADGSLVEWPGETNTSPGNDFVQISSNLDHNLALRADGSLIGWGGDLAPEANDVPPGIVFFQIAAGGFHNLALSTVPTREAGPLTLWIGLKNSDDQGTQFDLKAELYKNNVPISIGKTLCITGVTRNPSLARETSVEFGPVFTRDLVPGDTLTLKFFTRIGTTPDGMKCSGPGGSHNNAVGLRAYYDAPTRPSRFSADISPYSLLTDLFLHSSGSNYFFNEVSPTGTMKYKDSGSVNFNNGNPWKEIGTWSMPVQ